MKKKEKKTTNVTETSSSPNWLPNKDSEKNTKDNKNMTNKQKKIIALVMAVIVTLCVADGCYTLDKHNKEVAQATAFDNVTVDFKSEYSDGNIAQTSKSETIDTTTLISVKKDGKVDKTTKISKVDVKDIDTSISETYTVNYTIITKDSYGKEATKTYAKSFVVTNVDSVAPVITFKKDKVTITVGDSYVPKDNIKSVKDEFDGDVSYSKEGTDGAYYTIDDSKLNTSKKGTYKITVTAVDSAGNEATKTFKVKVKKASSSSASASSTSTNNSNKSNTTTSKNNSSPSKNTTTNKSSSSSSSSSSSGNKNTTSSGSSNSSGTTQKQQKCNQVKVSDAWDEQVKVSDGWTETVVDSQAWTETDYSSGITKVACNGCGQEFNSEEEWEIHFGQLFQQGDTSHGGYTPHTYFNTIYHEAVTHQVYHEAQYKNVHHDAVYKTVCN